MPTVFDPVLRHWPVWALIASAVLLAIAHAFQTFGGLEPCTLCLQQRDIYWTAIGIAVLAIVAARVSVLRFLRPVLGIMLFGVFLGGALIAARHAGAEWKWWPGPQTCSGIGGGVSAASLSGLMHGAKVASPRCDEAAWVFLGLSMAGWNCLISLGLAGMSALAWIRSRRDG